MGFFAQAVVYAFIRKQMSGTPWKDENDDSPYLASIMDVFFKSQLEFGAAMLPGVGPVVSAMYGRFTHSPADDDIRLSPAIAQIEGAVHAPGDVYKAIAGDKLTSGEIRDVMSAVGMLSGIPTGLASKALQYGVDVSQGRIAKPDNVGDAVRGVLSGSGPKP
jgi:hypothetical protein